MNYLSFDEALFLGHLVTGIEVQTLQSISRTDLLDSALHAPQTGFGDKEFYPNILESELSKWIQIRAKEFR